MEEIQEYEDMHENPPNEETSSSTFEPFKPSFKIEQQARSWIENSRTKKENSPKPLDSYVTYGSASEDRNATKWYLPPGCCVVTITTPYFKGDRDFAKEYFQKLLIARECKGAYQMERWTMYKDYHCFQFGKDNFCPLCKVIHDNYNFQYKVKPGVYGGWMCWKTREWETHYIWGEIDKLYQ